MAAGHALLAAFAEAHPDPVFVEVGANDGVAHDKLNAMIVGRGWRGVLVEPVPHVFERLQATYRDVPGVALEQAAIGTEDGERPFFHLAESDDEGLPDWYDAIGSFSRDFVAAHREAIPDIDHRIVSIDVPVLTFDSLCRRHGLDSVDLLLVDAEGHDGRIVRSVDLARRRPRIVIYEHYHLDAAERAACTAHLRAAGYEFFEEAMDTYALDPRPDRLTSAFRRLRPLVPGATAASARRP